MRNRFYQSISLLSRVIPYNLYPRLVPRNVINVFYHAISDQKIPHVHHLYPVVPVDSFNQALDYLQDNQYHFVTYHQLQAYVDQGVSLPPRAVHLSFDDGFSQCYSVVRPILLERGLPCTFFLTVDWLDNRMLFFRHQISLFVHIVRGLEEVEQKGFLRRLNNEFSLVLNNIDAFYSWILAFREPDASVLNWMRDELGLDVAAYLAEQKPYLTKAQVLQLQADGFAIGAHGLSHRKLGFIPQSEIEPEIVGSCKAIQAITGESKIPFSFPQSAGNISRELLADILARNPEVGLLFDTKDLRMDVAFILNRVWAERPLSSKRYLHPISEIFKHAYQEAWVESVVHLLRGHHRINQQ